MRFQNTPQVTDSSSAADSISASLDRARLGAFWSAHRRLFWTLHSAWALATGVVVIVLARDRYGFVPWVVVFLAATWASTLFLGRRVDESAEGGASPATPGLREEATAYVTRTMYQETLFFLLPFYAYSTVVSSPNVVFMAMLGGLALLSCLDLVFDRWLRGSPVFSLVFFAIVAFAAVNLILPLLLPVRPVLVERIAVAVALTSAAPLAFQGVPRSRGGLLRVGAAAGTFAVLMLGFPGLVPPVPLRVESSVFASHIDRETLVVADTLYSGVDPVRLDGALFVLLEIFSPSVVPTSVNLEWRKDGEPVRSSREVEITAHDLGFRLWDGLRPEDGAVGPGLYEVTVRARGGRFFGRARLRVGA